MKKLKELCKNSFGIELEQLIPLQEDLIPFGKNAEDAKLFGSRVAAKNPYLLQGNINRFIKSCPEGYFLVGFWGHGINSYAFYFSQVDLWKTVLFRLPYGGVYMDNKTMAKCICDFLPNYFEFEKRLHGKVKYLIAIESMDFGYYKITLSDNKIIELEKSLLYEPRFEEKIGKLLKL